MRLAMSAETWKYVLTISGASMELIGLALVVADVRDARRAARRALSPYSPNQQMTFPVTATWRSSYEVRGTQPPLEARVARLERQLSDVTADFHDRIDTLRSDLRDEAFGRIRVAMAEAEEREKALREFISDQLDSGIGRRIRGTCLFVAGVLLSAAANLV